MYFISIYENRNGIIPNGLEVDPKMFRVSTSFAVGALTAAITTVTASKLLKHRKNQILVVLQVVASDATTVQKKAIKLFNNRFL